jgi:hypothetical protein
MYFEKFQYLTQLLQTSSESSINKKPTLILVDQFFIFKEIVYVSH